MDGLIIHLLVLLIMIFIGIILASKEREKAADNNADHRKAIEIETDEDFDYGLKTSVGNVFAHGIVEAVDPVYVDFYDEALLAYKIDTEAYTRHERNVLETIHSKAGRFHTRNRTEVYYSWDIINSENSNARKIRFKGKIFDYEKIDLPKPEYMETVQISPRRRKKYYVLPDDLEGSVYTCLKDGQISDKSKFFKGVDSKTAKITAIDNENKRTLHFWILWAITAAAIEIAVFFWRMASI